MDNIVSIYCLGERKVTGILFNRSEQWDELCIESHKNWCVIEYLTEHLINLLGHFQHG